MFSCVLWAWKGEKYLSRSPLRNLQLKDEEKSIKAREKVSSSRQKAICGFCGADMGFLLAFYRMHVLSKLTLTELRVVGIW